MAQDAKNNETVKLRSQCKIMRKKIKDSKSLRLLILQKGIEHR